MRRIEICNVQRTVCSEAQCAVRRTVQTLFEFIPRKLRTPALTDPQERAKLEEKHNIQRRKASKIIDKVDCDRLSDSNTQLRLFDTVGDGAVRVHCTLLQTVHSQCGVVRCSERFAVRRSGVQ